MTKDDVFIEETRNIDTDYETERNKPVPNIIHGRIQLNLGFELNLKYQDQFNLVSEVTLNTQPKFSTPDICIYPKKNAPAEGCRGKDQRNAPDHH